MAGYIRAVLAAGVALVGAGTDLSAAAPRVAIIPDIVIGDLEDSTGEVDANRFLFPDAFRFDDLVIEADISANSLRWSFGEAENELGSNQYLINGKAAINQTYGEILEDQLAGHPKAVAPGTEFDIRLGAETASFRDIVLSPLPEQGVYPAPSTTETEAASHGKLIRYYISDGTDVTFRDTQVRTIDDAADWADVSKFEYGEDYRQSEFNSTNWVNQGLAWEAVSTNATSEALSITVLPSQGKSRIFGWRNPKLLNYDSVGPDRFVRGKFYIYTDVSVFDDQNKVPNFRVGLMNEDAVRAMAHFELSASGMSDPGYEEFYPMLNNRGLEGDTMWLRPADTQFSPTPSLYRVDFDPVDVPASAGSSIGAFFESYALSDTANGSLFLTEIVLGTYEALDNSGELVWAYYRDGGLGDAGVAGGAKTMYGGGFNHEANLTPGYLPKLYFEGQDEGGYFTLRDEGADGLVGDTDAVGTDVFGVGVLSLESESNADKLRIDENRLYHARFYATAPVPTDSTDPDVESQGQVRFRFQSVAGRVSYLLEILTLAIGEIDFDDTPHANDIARQALPGIGSENPDTDPALDTPGEDGGWYSVVVASPLDISGIRNDVQTRYNTVERTFFFLSAAYGSGEAQNSPLDVALGVDLVQAAASIVILSEPVIQARRNRAVVRVSAVEVYSYPSIIDGGFDATIAPAAAVAR